MTSVSTTESPTASGWKAGAKALAAFQAEHHGVAKGGMVDGGPRKGSKYATLTDILAVCAKVLQRTAFPTPARLAWSAKPSWYGGKCFTTSPVKASTPSTPSPSRTRACPANVSKIWAAASPTPASIACRVFTACSQTMGLILMRSATAMPEHPSAALRPHRPRRLLLRLCP